MTSDVAFKVIPKSATFFYIWRIEKMHLVPLSRELYGRFYQGDSYIVYSASEYGQPGGVLMKQRDIRGNPETHIHFWLGSETSQDEAGVAAYKTVELDDFLGGSPIQHREVEGKESKRFISYFKEGLRIMKGGVASGFRHVTDDFSPRLYHVKGKRTPIIRELPSVSWKLMNDGDVFVLDCREMIFVWTGRNANRYEKIQGAKFGQRLKSEHGTAVVVILEDGQETMLAQTEKESFNKHLSLELKKVTSASDTDSDDKQDARLQSEIKLYSCSDEEGTLKVTEVKEGPLFQGDLHSGDSFIVDNGEQGIWVWVGKRASKKERAEAMRNAQGFIKKKGYPTHTTVTRVIDGGEPSEFQCLFRDWREKSQQVGLGRQASASRIAQTVQTKFDASTLHKQRDLAADTQMVDGGTGSKEIWRVEGGELVALPKGEYGRFFMGDCYVILYTYTGQGQERHIIYYWLGTHSAQDEQGAAALRTVELDDKMGGQPMQVRVVQGREPPHFMAMFQGKMVVFKGGKASQFDGEGAQDDEDTTVYLLQVRGTTLYNTKAVEVDMSASSLNSNDVFVLRDHSRAFVWCGKGSTGDEREMAKSVAQQESGEIITVYESQEKEDFWKAIGGHEPYASDKKLQDSTTSNPSRLFHMSNATGNLKVEEIIDFNQTDLIPEDVMLLDSWHTLFIWVGAESNKQEVKLSAQASLEYMTTDPSGRTSDTPIVMVKQGFEPPTFTGFFGVWDDDLWKTEKSFADLKQEIMGENPDLASILPVLNGRPESRDGPKYPLEKLLVKDTDQLPQGVDPLRKEAFLTDRDFNTIFFMDYSDFECLPKWKQVELKKAAGLF